RKKKGHSRTFVVVAPTISAPATSRPKAEWSSRTASTARSRGMTQEILISEVETILIRIPASVKVANIFAATPGRDTIPAPTADTLASPDIGSASCLGSVVILLPTPG